mmetsp:Transcript_9599/g.24752  ORF Transcript_9599/g.24752 Transcript_9599/m.24752 type:complete len:279 (+) Transcript_9599:1-837(+)
MLQNAFERPLLMEGAPRHRTHYEVLGVQPSASSAEIRTRFHALMEEEMQQEGGGDHSTMAMWSTCHAVLGDPWRRRDYDEGCSGKLCSLRTRASEALEAECAERAERKRVVFQAMDRQQRQELLQIVAKGAAKSQLAGSYKCQATEGSKSFVEIAQQKKVEMESMCKAQCAKIKEAKAKAAAREVKLTEVPVREDPFPFPQRSASSERVSAAIAGRVAELRVEARDTGRHQRQLLREAVARGAAKSSIPRPRSASRGPSEDVRRPPDLPVAAVPVGKA